MTEDKSSLGHKFEELKHRLTERQYKLAARGVLSGDTRMKANARQIERVYAAKLAEELAKGAKYPQRRATIAAEIEALKLYFSQWVALIDREFKAGR